VRAGQDDADLTAPVRDVLQGSMGPELGDRAAARGGSPPVLGILLAHAPRGRGDTRRRRLSSGLRETNRSPVVTARSIGVAALLDPSERDDETRPDRRRQAEDQDCSGDATVERTIGEGS
jgi:hypothetical protein